MVCETTHATALRLGVDWNAADGMTMGADHLAHGLVVSHDGRWFSVRQQPRRWGASSRWTPACSAAAKRCRLPSVRFIADTRGPLSQMISSEACEDLFDFHRQVVVIGDESCVGKCRRLAVDEIGDDCGERGPSAFGFGIEPRSHRRR